jgi:ferredoxin
MRSLDVRHPGKNVATQRSPGITFGRGGSPMNTITAATAVWVEDGCICCQVCVATAPAIFFFPDQAERAWLRGTAVVDGNAGHQEDRRTALTALALADPNLQEAIANCPVEVIRTGPAR